MASNDPWHCPNGHLIFIINNTRGCLDKGCPFKIVKPKASK